MANPLEKYKKGFNPLEKYKSTIKLVKETPIEQPQPLETPQQINPFEKYKTKLAPLAQKLTEPSTALDIATLGQVTALKRFGEARKATRVIVDDVRKKIFGVKTFKGELPKLPRKPVEIALSPFKGIKDLNEQIEAVNTDLAENLADLMTDIEFWGFVGVGKVSRSLIKSKTGLTDKAIKDARKVIKIPKNATQKQLKSVYNKMNLSGKYRHADRGGNSELNAQLHEAYETLAKNQSSFKMSRYLDKFSKFFKRSRKVNISESSPIELDKALTEYQVKVQPTIKPDIVPVTPTQVNPLLKYKLPVAPEAITPAIKPVAPVITPPDLLKAVEPVKPVAKEIEPVSDIDRFIEGKSNLEKGRISKTLNNKVTMGGKVVTRAEVIQSRIDNGYNEISDTGILRKKGDIAGYKINKTESLYAKYLIDKPIPKPRVQPIAKKVEKPTIKVEPTIKPKVDIQKKQARVAILAKEKELISKKGKFKPQYRKLAEGMFGKKIRTRDMTAEQLDILANAIQSLPEPTYRAGKLIPPSIPKTSRLVKEEFFRRKFKEPTPIQLLTSQNYYAELLGVSELTKPLELAKQRMDLEYRSMSNATEQMGIQIDKIAKTTLKEKLAAKVKNIPTKAVEEMRDLLDTYEEAPKDLAPKKVKVFNWFRNLNRTMLKGENELRRKLDMPKIPNRKAYVKHVASAMAQEMMQGKYPFPEGLKFWAEKMVGKKIFNPSEFRRQLAEDVEGLFSKDLMYATKSMLWTGLKEIHLSEPLRSFNEQLGALSKDLPIYEDLEPSELNQLREMSVMPASTKKWLINYVNTVIKGQETDIDALVNRTITKTGIGGVLNKILKPFGRVLSQRPITKTFGRIGRLIVSGTMGWRPRQLIRNKFQLTQNLALYTLKANVKGFFPASVDKNLERLMKKSEFLKAYTGIEELPTSLQGKLEKLWLAPFQWTAVSNANQSMKVAYWDTLDLITKPKYKSFGWADEQRTYKEPEGKLYKSEEDKLLKEMEFGAGVTQFSYIPIGMPQLFRYKAFTPATRLQSWWMNYFTKFTREAIYRGFKGETSYGAKLPPSRRLGYLRYLMLGGAILTSLGYKKAFLAGVFPTYMSPAAQVALGIYTYATASSAYQRNQALRRMYYSWRAFIPGSMAWTDFHATWTGKKPLISLFRYEKGKK